MAIYSNDTNNTSMMTAMHDQDILSYMDIILNPLVCLVGTTLNLLAVGAFLSVTLRKISCCLYLAMRSIAVFGFLVSMGIAWSNSFSASMRTEGICEVTQFLSYFCPFLSVWMVVAISAENFIRIAQPSRVGTFCTPRVAKMVIATVCLLGVGVYHFPLWSFKVVDGECQPLQQHMQTVLIINYVDTALTLLAPFALLLILVPLVALAAIHSFERKKRLSLGNPRSSILDTGSRSPEAKVTHLLLAVSVVFLLLHAPFHSIRTKFFILSLTDRLHQATSWDTSLLRVFRMVYNLDTCASCIVYFIFGDNFRRVFCQLYFSRCKQWYTVTGHPRGVNSPAGGANNCSNSRNHHFSEPLSTTVVTSTIIMPQDTTTTTTTTTSTSADAEAGMACTTTMTHEDDDVQMLASKDEDDVTTRVALLQPSSTSSDNNGTS